VRPGFGGGQVGTAFGYALERFINEGAGVAVWHDVDHDCAHRSAV